MPVHFGRDAFVAYNSATYGSPTWVEFTTIRDVQIPDGERATLDASGRDYGIELFEPGLLKLGIDFMIRTNESDTPFTFLETAALLNPTATGAMLDILILTGRIATNGNRGFRLDMKIHKFFGEDQALDKILYRSVKLLPCAPTNPPKSVVITGGVPVYTTLAV